jgi:hypothetical protein
MVKCRAVGRLDKNSHRQLRHVSNIGVGETTATAQRKHGGNALQKNVALLDRDPRAAVMMIFNWMSVRPIKCR